MKKTLIVLISILFWATAAMADQVDRGLPQSATAQIKDSTRQVINSGLNSEAVLEMTRNMLEHNFNHDQILQLV